MESHMLPTRANTHNITWMEPQAEHLGLATWTNTNINNIVGIDPTNDDIPSFKSILQGDWYMNSTINHDLPNLPNHNETNRDIGFSSNPNDNFLMQPLDFSPNAPSFTQQSCFTPFFNVNCNNPFESTFNFGSESGFLNSNSPILMGFNALPQMSNLELSSNPEFNATRAVELDGGFNQMGVVQQPFDGLGSSNVLFSNNANVLQPIEVSTLVAPPPQSLSHLSTLFQKRRQGSGDVLGALEVPAAMRLWEISEERGLEEGLNYDLDEVEVVEIDKLEENKNNGGIILNANNNNNGNDNDDNYVNGGDHKGKKKGMPAKNLMAERRRRKRLNDRLYMLRSVVPRISKMDRASILEDAIEYLKDLLQRVNDLQIEMESISPSSSLSPSTSFNPVTPTLPTLPSRMKEELHPSYFPSPKIQSPKVEVMVREGRAVNIHMFCARKPGIFLSTMRALDSLGLDVQQAVISCFNGFALDVFRAEQRREDSDLHPEQIQAVLLDIAGFH